MEAGHLIRDPSGGDGQRHLGSPVLRRDKIKKYQQRPLVVDQVAAFVHDRDAVTGVVETDAEGSPRAGDERAETVQRAAAVGRGLGRDGLVQSAVDGEDIHPEASQQGGQHQRGRSPGRVDHDFQVAFGQTRDVHLVQQVTSVDVGGPGGEAQLPDLAGKGPPELLAADDPVECALCAEREISALGIHEADVDPFGVPRRRAHHDAAGRVGGADVEAGHRHRRDLQVPYVHRARGKRADHRSLERPGRPGAVPDRGDG